MTTEGGLAASTDTFSRSFSFRSIFYLVCLTGLVQLCSDLCRNIVYCTSRERTLFASGGGVSC